MTDDVEMLREAVAGAREEVQRGEERLANALEDWRSEFGKAIEPSMIEQARRYFEHEPKSAKTLDADGVKRLKGTVRATAASMATSLPDQITLDKIKAAIGVNRLRLDLLGQLSKAMEEALRPTFRWSGWIVTHQTARTPNASLNDLEELEAYQNVDAAINALSVSRQQLSGLQERLDRAEALDLWNSPDE